MKICFFAGANSVHSHRWIKYFTDKDHEIHWISLMPSIEPVDSVISYYDLGPLSTNPFKILIQALRVRNLIKKIRPDIFHVHSAGTYGLIGALANFHPLIITIWGSDILLSKGIKREMVRFVIGSADLLTCDGDNTAKAIMNFGVKPEKIEMNYWGVDIKKFKQYFDEHFKDKIFDSKSLIVISMRSLEPIYDVENLVEAIPLILKEVPQARFIIMGDGTRRKYLQDRVNSAGAANTVKFLGAVPSTQIPAYLGISDIYVSTALSDSGLAASTAEAMACGLPVIVTDSGDNRKWVEDGENGFIVPVKNPEMMAEKIVYLLKHRELKEKMSQANRKIIEEKNNYYKEMQNMEFIYEKISKEYKEIN